MTLTVAGFGPFLKGITDGANPSLDMSSTLRSARHATLSGAGRLMAGPGSSVAMTLMDDAGTPAACTAVLAVVPFADGCLAVGYSSATQKVYLYRLDALFTKWYNLAGTPTTSTTATPLATALWTVVTTAPAVTIAEILGSAYIFNNSALTSTSLDWPVKKYDGSAITTLSEDLDGTGAKSVYSLGGFAFHGHLWTWGYDKGNVASTAYRPELLRFGGPDGGSLVADGKGTFTVGHRIRSSREAIVGAMVAGEVAYIGTTYSLWPVVGYGRDTWDKSRPLDDSFGFISLSGQVSANGVLYYWSPRGPARVEGLNKPEPLWDALPVTVPGVVDPQKIVAGFDADRDQVLWYYRGGTKTGNQLLVAYDIRRDVFLGPDTDQGILVGCAGLVAPVTAPSGAGAAGPAGPPTSASTTAIGDTTATANWLNGDTNTDTVTKIEYRQQGTPNWIAAGTAASGVTSLTITGLASGSTPYEWRAYHVRNSQSSAYLGPIAATQFTTGAGALTAPTGCTLTDLGPSPANQGYVEWTNSGESGVSTEVYIGTSLKKTVGPGVSSATCTITATGTYTAKVRHVKTGSTPSAYSTSAPTTLTYSPFY